MDGRGEVWTVSTMAVAPVKDCARALLEGGGDLDWVFGEPGSGSDVADPAALELDAVAFGSQPAWAQGLGLGGLRPHLTWGALARNAANYMLAANGTLVALDPWRGMVSAMALGRARALPREAGEFGPALDAALARVGRALGPCCLFHRAGGGGSGPVGWVPDGFAWPSLEDYMGRMAQREALEEAAALRGVANGVKLATSGRRRPL